MTAADHENTIRDSLARLAMLIERRTQTAAEALEAFDALLSEHAAELARAKQQHAEEMETSSTLGQAVDALADRVAALETALREREPQP